MKKQILFELIESLSCDIEFVYNGVNGSICPFSRNDIAVIYGDEQKKYDDIDVLMSDKIYNGKCLNDISENLEIM